MTLPRFTQGQIGRLSFSDINAAFEKIDDIARNSDATRAPGRIAGEMVLARILDPDPANPGAFSFIEVTRDSTAGTSLFTPAILFNQPISRTSKNDQSDFAYPVIASAGSTPVPGEIMLIVSQYTEGGSLYYVPIASGAQGGTAEYWSIVGATSAGQNRWQYDMASAQWNALSQDFITSTVVQRKGYNTAEWAVDSSSYGVGFIPAGAPSQVVRQPIKSGTIVRADRINRLDPQNFDLAFTVPNGYRIVC